MTVQHDVPVSPAVTAGIDWASSEHAVALVDEHGIQRQRRTVPHTKAGIGQLVAMLSRAGVTEVGIERGDGPLVEALIAARFTVYVIAPNQIRSPSGGPTRPATAPAPGRGAAGRGCAPRRSEPQTALPGDYGGRGVPEARRTP